MSASFDAIATVTASTKRGSISSGKRSTPTENIASLACTPLDPVSAEIRQRPELKTPHELLQTFVDSGADVKEGDILTVSGTDYPIRAVGDWEFAGSTYLHLVIEELKR